MRLYLLGFASVDGLHDAFELISDSEWVASCLVEPQQHQIRFVAPEDRGEDLVHHIYQRGGLRWCSRHSVTPAK